jgi:transcriptional regulator with XRE-family HTH domain
MAQPASPTAPPISSTVTALEAARLRCGLTYASLAPTVGCTPQYLGRVMRGEQTPSLPLLLDLAAALGLHELYRQLRPLVRRTAS